MPDMNREVVQQQCKQFLESLGNPGFIVLGWQKDDGTYDIVQSTKAVNPIAYTKGLIWALYEMTKKM